jgi:hypothetical protein
MRAAPWIFLAWFLLAPLGCNRAEQDWDEIARHLPSGIRLSTPLQSRMEGNRNREGPTVKDELIELGAHLKDGKLYGRSGNEIIFHFRFILVGGAVPGPRQERQESEREMAWRKELAGMREYYEVVVITHYRLGK